MLCRTIHKTIDSGVTLSGMYQSDTTLDKGFYESMLSFSCCEMKVTMAVPLWRVSENIKTHSTHKAQNWALGEYSSQG